MGKISIILIITILFLEAKSLEQDCLACHKEQQIPSELIYKRYLMRYSTHNSMGSKMLEYLKNPQKSNSIMPSQFFLKFPMKKMTHLKDEELKENIKLFLNRFDIKKRLKLAN
jgi:hypothetical protein